MNRKKIAAILCVLFGGSFLVAISQQSRTERVATPEPSETTIAQPAINVQSAGNASSTGTSNAKAKVLETHEKVINYTVSVPVRETHTKDVQYTVMTPVAETHVKDVNYTVMRVVEEEHTIPGSDESGDRIVKTVKHIPESRVKSVSYTVTKMVPERRTKTVTYTTCRYVSETRQKTVQYTTTREVDAATLQNEADPASESELDPMGSNRCLN